MQSTAFLIGLISSFTLLSCAPESIETAESVDPSCEIQSIPTENLTLEPVLDENGDTVGMRQVHDVIYYDQRVCE